MKPPKGVTLVSAKYYKDYKFRFVFSNTKESIVDFEPMILHGTALRDYLNISKFKKINIDGDRGNIYWGENWDMCFHIESYYNETAIYPIKKKGGRKPLGDKKVLIRLYVRQSVIDANGGMEAAQGKCENILSVINNK